MDPETTKILNHPFERDQIKSRRGPDGKMLSYVAIQAYVDRLNLAFSTEWSFELSKREQTGDQVIVEVRLSARGITKTGLGGATIIRRKEGGEVIDLANDYKRAEADALKRACRLLGMGAELYASEQDDEAGVIGSPPPSNGSYHQGGSHAQPPRALPPRERLTSAQLNAIKAIAGRRRLDSANLRGQVKERFGVEIEYLSKHQASLLIGHLDGDNGSSGHQAWAG